MPNTFRNAGLLAVAVCLGTAAQATVLTFEDTGAENFFTATYNGFNFGNNNAATNTWFHTNFAGAPYAPPSSGTRYIGTDSSKYGPGAPTDPAQASEAITAAGNLFNTFIFDGASFTGYATDSIHYELYLLGGLVYTSTDVSISSVPSFIATGYSGMVDAVRVFGFQGYYGLDDFTYRLTADVPGSVPEPGSYALVLIAMAAVGAVRRKRPG